TVRLKGPDGRVRTAATLGTGPLDAAFKAIDQIVKAPAELVEYSLNAITGGIDALGDASVRLKPQSGSEPRVNPQSGVTHIPTFHGHATDTDIIVASTKAYLSALNRLIAASHADEGESAKTSSTIEAMGQAAASAPRARPAEAPPAAE